LPLIAAPGAIVNVPSTEVTLPLIARMTRAARASVLARAESTRTVITAVTPSFKCLLITSSVD
jgi:hypothetical protein